MFGCTLQIQVDFNVKPENQFDQGGIIVYRDPDTWLKTGIEVVDGVPRLSCVVTRHGFSDWSTQSWPATSLTLRLSQTGNGSYVVEVCVCVFVGVMWQRCAHFRFPPSRLHSDRAHADRPHLWIGMAMVNHPAS